MPIFDIPEQWKSDVPQSSEPWGQGWSKGKGCYEGEEGNQWKWHQKEKKGADTGHRERKTRANGHIQYSNSDI